VHELKTTIIGLATGTIRIEDVLDNAALCRTYYFFDVGSRIPLRDTAIDRETLHDEMLEDIEIDL